MIAGTIQLPSLDRVTVEPGVTLVGEPLPIPGTNKFNCLALVEGCLCLVELSIKFQVEVDWP